MHVSSFTYKYARKWKLVEKHQRYYQELFAYIVGKLKFFHDDYFINNKLFSDFSVNIFQKLKKNEIKVVRTHENIGRSKTKKISHVFSVWFSKKKNVTTCSSNLVKKIRKCLCQ